MASVGMAGIKGCLVLSNGVQKEGPWGGMFDLRYEFLIRIFGVKIILLEKEKWSS